MITYPKISIVTPSYNQVDFLEQTIRSILSQGYPNLEYIIIDGGSSDGSVEIIKKYDSSLAYWETAKDEGMYHALNKGFSKSTGEIMGWTNSDDVLAEGALFTMADLFSRNKKVEWIQGYPTVINVEGKIVFQRPQVYSKYFFFLHQYRNYQFIQQESTFWKRGLWLKSGGELDTQFSVAADFDLWMRFFLHAKLYCTDKQLGAFRSRQGQLSQNKERYLKEASVSVKKNYQQLGILDQWLVRGLLFFDRGGLGRASLFGRIKNKLVSLLLYRKHSLALLLFAFLFSVQGYKSSCSQ